MEADTKRQESGARSTSPNMNSSMRNPGRDIAMFRNEKPQTGRWVCMIKVRLRVGDLRQLRSSLWVRSTSHIPSPTPSPPANRCNSYLPSYPSTRAIPIPTRQPLIIPEPTRDPEKSSTSSASMNVIRLLPPDTTPVHSSLSSRLISPSF